LIDLIRDAQPQGSDFSSSESDVEFRKEDPSCPSKERGGWNQDREIIQADPESLFITKEAVRDEREL